MCEPDRSGQLQELDIVCFGDSDWWYHNHGHMDIQLMRRYAREGKILYINSIVIRKLNIMEGAMFLRRVKRKFLSILQGLKKTDIDNMFVYSPFTMPVHHINLARQLNEISLRLQIKHRMRGLKITKPIVWVACPGAAQSAVKLPREKLVYQRSDRYEDLPGVDPEQIRRYDLLLKEHADLVIYANRKLMSQEKARCKKAIFLDHGVDFEMFSNAHMDQYIPEEMELIPHPVLGFYGSIDDHTSDISLIEKLADLLCDISIVLVGNSSVDLSTLASHRNVYLLKQKPYEQIPHYAKCFDVCFMPWRQNEWIKACNPIKLKEYLAMGKPIVSTPFNELEHYTDLVYVASDAKSFAEAVRKACNEHDPKLALARRKRVSDSNWDSKARQVLHALYEMN
jgi:glycosyltransferase involved in cell wall biosynthesis